MTDFIFRDESEWSEEIRKMLEEAGTPVTDWAPGSSNRTFWEIAAKLSAQQDYMLERLLNLFFLDYEDEDIDIELLKRRVAERGIIQKPGSYAKGQIVFTRTTPAPFDITVPAGTTFSTLDRSITVETTEQITMQTGQQEITAAVQAVEKGEESNLSAGTELIQTGIAIIGIEEVRVGEAGLSGGVSEESAEKLRDRFLDKVKNPDGAGTKRDYERWAKEVPGAGILTATCIPLARGPGTADIIITTTSGIPSSEVIAQCQSYIDERSMMNADILVCAPEQLPLDIVINYTASVSYDDAIRQEIEKYTSSIGVGGIVRLSSFVVAARSVQGVEDAWVESPTSNIQLSSRQMPVIRTLTIRKVA